MHSERHIMARLIGQKLKFALYFEGGVFKVEIIQFDFFIQLNHSFREFVSANFKFTVAMGHKVKISLIEILIEI